MPGFPTQHAALSYRPKAADDATAHRDPDSPSTFQNSLNKEQLFQDVVRLAARSSHPHAPSQDRDVEAEGRAEFREARRGTALELANAASRNDYWSDKQIRHRSKGQGKGRSSRMSKSRNDRSDGDGLDDLNCLFAEASYEEQAQEDRSEEDGLDDLNRLIPTTEQSVDCIAGEMDVEFGGMRDALATEDEWRTSSDVKRAALEKAMLAARAHGDYISRFDQPTYEELARIQQQLFQTSGDDAHQQAPYASSQRFINAPCEKEAVTYEQNRRFGEANGSGRSEAFVASSQAQQDWRSSPEAAHKETGDDDAMDMS